jgi:hypothetical protein
MWSWPNSHKNNKIFLNITVFLQLWHKNSVTLFWSINVGFILEAWSLDCVNNAMIMYSVSEIIWESELIANYHSSVLRISKLVGVQLVKNSTTSKTKKKNYFNAVICWTWIINASNLKIVHHTPQWQKTGLTESLVQWNPNLLYFYNFV